MAHAAILRGHSQPWTPFRVWPLRHGDAGARLQRRHVNAPHRGPYACRPRLANVRVQMATARSQRDPHDHSHHTPAAHQPARPDRVACRLCRQGAAPTARAAGTLTAHRRGHAGPAGAVRVRNHGAQFCQLPHLCGGTGTAAAKSSYNGHARYSKYQHPIRSIPAASERYYLAGDCNTGQLSGTRAQRC
ncbi:hypothetical protein SMD_0992 [Stenotrophomonas maltophilia D457]|nr:hypothetical protein SMD_0992 [Stenotrophomonas maltophilia D457]